MRTFLGHLLPASPSSSEAAGVARRCIVLIVGMLCVLAAASNVTAAPFEIEGIIKQVRTIETKPPYTFDDKAVISIYLVGHRYGKDFDYQYMVVKDTTQLEGISFSDLETGKYVRVKSRPEPPGMVGKPIQEIRASRYGCCNFALHVDTVSTPRNISAVITRVESFGPNDVVVAVREEKPGAREFKYLLAEGRTTIRNGGFSDVKVSARIDISNAGINVPVPQGVDHGKLHGADLFAAFVVMYQGVAQKEIPTDGLKLWFRADRGVTHSDNRVSQWEDQSGSNLHAKTAGGQPMLLASAIGGKPAIHLNGKGDTLEFSGWSPNGLTEMTITIVCANTEFQPEPYKGGWDEGGHCGTLQSVITWPEQPGTGPGAWGNVILAAFQKSVSYRFGTGQKSNSNNWKRPASIGDSPTMTTATKDGATERVYVEGELVWTQTDKLATIKNTDSKGFIGRWSHGGDNSGWYLGNVAEIIVYTRALNDAERKTVEDYLKAKYFAVSTASAAALKGVELHQTSNSIEVNIDGKPFTSYIYQLDPAKPLAAEGVLLTKPVLFPLRTPSGIKVTRGWPFEKIEGESPDHPHHMGLYFTYDIPGNSFWNNSTQPLPVIRQIRAQIAGDPHGNPAIQSVMHWIGKDDNALLVEKRLTSFIAGTNQNIIDTDIELQAVADTVEFGVTKEGMFAIRLAQWLTEGGGTGAYLSSNGDEKESGVWGKRADWVRIQGEHKGATVGIAILNHPTSTNYPTYWHARGYGCFSANPLGQYAFEKSRKVENPQPFNLTLRKGETAPFKFRVILYDGARTKQQLDSEFREYAR